MRLLLPRWRELTSFLQICSGLALLVPSDTAKHRPKRCSVQRTGAPGALPICTIETDFNAAVLLCDDLYYELICDSMGVHVRREMLQLTKKLVGASRIIGITDACGGPSGTGDVNFEDGELNGSKLTMDQVAKNFYAAGFSLSEIAMVTAGNAAKLLGIYSETGSLEQGKRADIVALEKDFTVKRVYKA